MSKKPDREYWRDRFKQMEEAQNTRSMQKVFEIQDQFNRAISVLDKKIELWYQRLANNNGVSMSEARKLLSDSELKEFRWSLEEYVEHGKENIYNQKWVKELENASARVHISRLEALKYETQAELEKMFGNYIDVVDQHIRDTYLTDYYHTIYEIHKGFELRSSISQLDDIAIRKIVSKPWSVDGKNFSDRIWGNKTKLINTIHKSLSTMCITGAGPDQAIKEISKIMNVSMGQAGRLVMTESAAFANMARQDSMKELGVEEFEVVETLDSHTCTICREMDGKHFPLYEFEIGVTAPVFHPSCRGCICPFIDDEFDFAGERAARGKDGKTYYVPADMTYKEWEKDTIRNGNRDKSVLQEDGLVKVLDHGITKSIQKREVDDVHTVGKINKEIYKCITEDIVTDEVIITNERIAHVMQRHPSDYERFCEYIPEIISDPDYIIKANKPNTAVILKQIEKNNEKFQLVLRIKASKDAPEFKNSIMTFLKISERTWNKYLRNKEILYKKE